MSESQPYQQLMMALPETELKRRRPIVLPEGYSLQVYEPKYADAHIELMHLAGFHHWDRAGLERDLRAVLPNGLFFAVWDETDTPVATAMAMHTPTDDLAFEGALGWLAGHPEHAGKNLGVPVCAAVANRFAEAGYRRVFLRTDDWRLPAIKTYLSLGWLPFLFLPEMEGRWRDVCAKLKWPFTPEKWPRQGDQPAAQPEDDERPNADSVDRYPLRRKWLPYREARFNPGGGDKDTFGDESLYKSSGLGTAYVEPREVQAGAKSALKIVYTAGPEGVQAGTRVKFAIAGQSPLGRDFKDYTLKGPKGCAVKLAMGGAGFLVEEGELVEGQQVVLTAKPFEWTPLAGRREIKVTFHWDDGRPEKRLREPLVIDVTPLSVHRLEAVLPCTHRPGEQVSVAVTSRDANDNRVHTNTPIAIAGEGFTASGHLIDGRAVCHLEQDVGSPGRVTVRAEELGLECESNPSLACEDYQLYVGDLHAHDFLSQAEGYTDDVYRWAIEDRKLDFVSVVPQSHGWHDNDTWTIVKYMNERFLDEGRFVTFLGLEWQHTGYGDKVIHYLGGDQPYLPVEDRRYTTPAKLYRALRNSDALVISHHPSYREGSWCAHTYFDDVENDLERVVEIWSMHGSSEGYDEADRPLHNRDPHNTAMDALLKGLRLGFVAGSDTHSARPGGSAKEPLAYWGGLAAVWAKDLSRRSVFEAIRARRTYALTRARIILQMTVNGAWMGSELPASETADIHIRAWAPRSIEKLEIVKNTRSLKTFGPFGDTCEIELRDCTEGPAFYHCRVTQSDGELAVCSPVWIG